MQPDKAHCMHIMHTKSSMAVFAEHGGMLEHAAGPCWQQAEHAAGRVVWMRSNPSQAILAATTCTACYLRIPLHAWQPTCARS